MRTRKWMAKATRSRGMEDLSRSVHYIMLLVRPGLVIYALCSIKLLSLRVRDYTFQEPATVAFGYAFQARNKSG